MQQAANLNHRQRFAAVKAKESPSAVGDRAAVAVLEPFRVKLKRSVG
jgi:hypothetical protein